MILLVAYLHFRHLFKVVILVSLLVHSLELLSSFFNILSSLMLDYNKLTDTSNGEEKGCEACCQKTTGLF